jgi:hypothetical protein
MNRKHEQAQGSELSDELGGIVGMSLPVKHDPFRPHREPAMSLYDAFQAEAEKRPGRSVEEWIKSEREAVWRCAHDQAAKLALRCPTLGEVEAAERYAMGSINYGLTWALGVERVMRTF